MVREILIESNCHAIHGFIIRESWQLKNEEDIFIYFLNQLVKIPMNVRASFQLDSIPK